MTPSTRRVLYRLCSDAERLRDRLAKQPSDKRAARHVAKAAVHLAAALNAKEVTK